MHPTAIDELVKKINNDDYSRKLEFIASKKPKEKLVLFFGRDGFVDNSKYLFLSALQHRSKFESVWCTYNPVLHQSLTENGLPCLNLNENVQHNLAIMLKAAVVVHCVNTFESIRSDIYRAALSSAVSVQLWHGVGSKRLDLALTDQANLLNPNFINQLVGATKISCILSPASFWDHQWRSFFGVKQYIRAGYPRNEVIARVANKLEKLNAFQFTESERAVEKKILWAPTFTPADAKSIESQAALLNNLSVLCGKNNFSIYIKPHPFEKFLADQVVSSKKIKFINASLDIYPSLNEFDLLVTDFSSIATDFLFTEKPIVFCSHQFSGGASSILQQHSLPLPGVSCQPENLAATIEQVFRHDHMHELRREIRKVAFETSPLSSCEEINNTLVKIMEDI